MWIDERGSEVLGHPECRRLLALGAKEHRHGHLGIAGEGAPVVLPVDYAMDDLGIIVRVGEGLFYALADRLVAFQVDGRSAVPGLCGPEDERLWSVLVQGLATEEAGLTPPIHLPVPEVAEPGHRIVRIRTDVIAGRRLGALSASSQQPTDSTSKRP
jgi:pyridoxamine 5'-phosphate oxidase-like protein